MSRQIGICSGKGGVGKTFTCINLAQALQDLGEKVLIVDADMGLANAQLMLGISPELTVADYVLRDIPLTDVISNIKEGLDILPGASGDTNLVNLPLNTLSDLSYEIVNLFPDTIILFDIAAGISDQNMHLLRLCEPRGLSGPRRDEHRRQSAQQHHQLRPDTATLGEQAGRDWCVARVDQLGIVLVRLGCPRTVRQACVFQNPAHRQPG